MHKITDTIYIGNREDVKNTIQLHRLGVNCIYNVAHDVHDIVLPEFVYVKCGLYDGVAPANTPNPVGLAVDILGKLIQDGSIVLIHCYMGFNRAPYVVSRYLARENSTNWQEEFAKIKAIRSGAFIKDWMLGL